MPEESQEIVLASASPRRSALLEKVGVRCQVIPSDTDEVLIAEETAEAHAVRLSRDKALEVARRQPVAGRWFIGSDTIVVLDGAILGKPADAAAARAMLNSLSGRHHRVVSGYAVHDRVSGRTISAADYLAALDWRDTLYAGIEEVFERYDAIVTPAAPGEAPFGLDSTGSAAFNSLWTLLGVPAVTVPLLTGANGLPVGVQLIGPRFNDGKLLRSARWLVHSLASNE